MNTQLTSQRNAIAQAFDARVEELHTQLVPAAMPGAPVTDVMALLDQTVQQQWQQLQGLLSAQSQTARPAFGCARGPTPPADIVDVSAREMPGGS